MGSMPIIVPDYLAVKKELLITWIKTTDFFQVVLKKRMLGEAYVRDFLEWISLLVCLHEKSRAYYSTVIKKKLMSDEEVERWKVSENIMNHIKFKGYVPHYEEVIFLQTVASDYLGHLGITNIKVADHDHGLDKLNTKYNLGKQ